jgi:hypothetical protein
MHSSHLETQPRKYPCAVPRLTLRRVRRSSVVQLRQKSSCLGETRIGLVIYDRCYRGACRVLPELAALRVSPRNQAYTYTGL